MKHSVKKKLWIICCVLTVVFAATGLSPLVIPTNVFEPKLFGIPYTLWMGFIVTSLLVILTFLGSRIHPGVDSSEK